MFPFACKQNVNLRPIEQIRFSRREIRFSLKIPFLKFMSNFVGKMTPIRRLSAIYHIKYHAHSIADNAAAALDLPSRPAAAPRPEADCGAAAACVNGRWAACSAFYFTLFQPFPSQGTHLFFAISTHLREAARRRTLQNNGPTRGLSCTPLQTRPRGTPRILLAWQRVCKRRSHNAAGKCGGRRTRIRS